MGRCLWNLWFFFSFWTVLGVWEYVHHTKAQRFPLSLLPMHSGFERVAKRWKAIFTLASPAKSCKTLASQKHFQEIKKKKIIIFFLERGRGWRSCSRTWHRHAKQQHDTDNSTETRARMSLRHTICRCYISVYVHQFLCHQCSTLHLRSRAGLRRSHVRRGTLSANGGCRFL